MPAFLFSDLRHEDLLFRLKGARVDLVAVEEARIHCCNLHCNVASELGDLRRINALDLKSDKDADLAAGMHVTHIDAALIAGKAANADILAYDKNLLALKVWQR